jgi:DNA helicase IV
MADNSQLTEGTQEISKTQEAAEKITTAQPDTNTAVEAGKTFTQADVDRIIAERLQRERAKLPNDDELKAYREWKKSQQSEAEKAAEREKELAELHSKKTDLERELAVLKAGVRAKERITHLQGYVHVRRSIRSHSLARFVKENTEFTQPLTIKSRHNAHDFCAGTGRRGYAGIFEA